MVIGLVAGGIGSGVYAAFSNPAAATNNILTAGTLDLKTNNADGVSGVLSATTMKPGDSVGPATVTLKNDGTIDGSTLDINISYVENDGPSDPYAVNKTADQFADELVVNTLTYGAVDLLAALPLGTDIDGDGIDMKEAAAADLTGQAGIAAGASKDFVIRVTLKDVGNEFQADGIDVTINFVLNQ